MNLTKFSLLLALGAISCLAGQITSIASPTFTETYDGPGMAALFPNSCGGHPCANTPVTINGLTYSTTSGVLRFLPSDSGCAGTNCVNTSTDTDTITITFPTLQLQVLVGFFQTFGNSQVEFYGPSNTLLGTLSNLGANNIGWQDPAGIASIRLIDTSVNATSALLDNLQTEAAPASGVPEPSTFVLVGTVLAGLVIRRRRTRTSTANRTA